MNRSGLTLVEVMVAFSLLALGVLVLVAGQLSAVRWSAEARALQLLVDTAQAELALQRALATGALAPTPCRTPMPERVGIVEGDGIDCRVERIWCELVGLELVCGDGLVEGPAVEIRVTVTLSGHSPFTLSTLNWVGG